MIDAHAELVAIIAQGFGRKKSIRSIIGLWEERQQILRKRALRHGVGRIRSRHLVERIGLIEEDIEQLVARVVAHPGGRIEALGTRSGEISLPLGEGRDRTDLGLTLSFAEAFVVSEEESLIPTHRATESS